MAKLWTLILLGLFVFAGQAAAESAAIGHVRTVSGDAALVRDGSPEPAKVGSEVFRKDVIETGKDGSIGVTFTDNTVFSAGPNSSIALEEYAFNSSAFKGNLLARMDRGTLNVVSGDIARTSPEAMKVKTPTAILGVRGTTFLVKVDE